MGYFFRPQALWPRGKEAKEAEQTFLKLFDKSRSQTELTSCTSALLRLHPPKIPFTFSSPFTCLKGAGCVNLGLAASHLGNPLAAAQIWT